MSESREPGHRNRRPAIGLTIVSMIGLAAVCMFARCSGANRSHRNRSLRLARYGPTRDARLRPGMDRLRRIER